jgi:hypothetical protein
MAFTIRAFQVPKDGSRLDECEDALGWDEDKRLFAIADGATDSAFQRLWANLLVQGLISRPPNSFSSLAIKAWFGDWLKARQEQWAASIDWEGIPWHGLNKARQTGGLATFLGLHLFADKPQWQGIAFGDCNFFHLFSDGDIYDYQPSTLSSEFGIAPIALSSINPNPETMLKHMKEFGGKYHAGETMFLTTDALAVWLLKQIESNARAWRTLLDLKSPADFNTLVEELRRDKQIRNDDTSLLVIHIHEAPPAQKAE